VIRGWIARDRGMIFRVCFEHCESPGNAPRCGPGLTRRETNNGSGRHPNGDGHCCVRVALYGGVFVVRSGKKPPPVGGEAGALLWTMGQAAGFTEPPPWRLCTIAGPGGELRALGELAMVCSRPVGSRRPRGCGKSPKELAFAVPGWARGNVYPSPLPSLW
jgi:hypothetical protein